MTRWLLQPAAALQRALVLGVAVGVSCSATIGVGWAEYQNKPTAMPAYQSNGTPAQFTQEPLSPEAKEALLFFSKLVQDSGNPLISNWAQESLTRLKSGKLKPPASPRKEVVVSLLTQSNNSLAVPTMLNRKSMGTFLIDTGATYTVITPRLAQKLNISISSDLPKISIITANGVVKAPLVTVDSIMIGEMEVRNVKAIVQPLGDDLLLAGLLGMNFFQGMDMAVRQNKLILSHHGSHPEAETISSLK